MPSTPSPDPSRTCGILKKNNDRLKRALREATWEYAGGVNWYFRGDDVKLQADVTKVSEVPITSSPHTLANVNDDALFFYARRGSGRRRLPPSQELDRRQCQHYCAGRLGHHKHEVVRDHVTAM